MDSAAETSTIMDELRGALKRRTAESDGGSGIAGLLRSFALCDRDRSGELDLGEFAKCISQCKLGIDPERVAKLHGAFDRDGSGRISYDEFIRALRGAMPPKRRQKVEHIFHCIDQLGDGNGVLTIEDLRSRYDASRHPEVIAGRMDAHGALRAFLSTFEGATGDQRDGVVTLDEFLTYYEGVSAVVDSDDYFSQMLSSTWAHLKTAENKPALEHVPAHDIDMLEAMLYEATYRKKGGSHAAQEKLINDAFKVFDVDGSGYVDKPEFLRAMERFGLHVRGHGKAGIGGLPEAVVLALFDRYDEDGSVSPYETFGPSPC